VVLLMVAGFMGLLNVALMMAVLGHTAGLPLTGVSEVTVGAVRGAPGFPAPAFLSESPQPAMTAANRNAGIQILANFNVRI
jgi:hypothetical protein